jgi:linoleoyl-CoA desaturase
MPTPALAAAPDRLRRFGEELDQIRARAEARLGADDVRRVKRIDRASRALEVAGRALLHFSVEPLGFSAGVAALFLHKQLQATEIGHSALHGAWDGLAGAERYQSATYRWDTPIDEASWRRGHNIRHHQYTNIAGKDPDIHFGPVRLTGQTPHAPHHRWQLPFALFVAFPTFAFSMSMHFSGLLDVYAGNGRPERFDFIDERTPAAIRDAHARALRKWLPYYFKNFLFFPLLAGPGFLKVLAGNVAAEVLRDLYSAATIYCGHVGPETASYPEGTRAHGRGAFYAMQVAATNNFEVSRPLSILCGGLDRQIEHHLFPHLPPNRLREIAPEVRAACERHGVPYRTASWPKTLKAALGHIRALARDAGGPVAGVRAVVREMT